MLPSCTSCSSRQSGSAFTGVVHGAQTKFPTYRWVGQQAPHRPADGLHSLDFMHEPLFHIERILDPITLLPLTWPFMARRVLLRVGDLRAPVSARLIQCAHGAAGRPAHHAGHSAGEIWAALQSAAPQAECMVSVDSSDLRMWRREAGGRLHVTHVVSASGTLLPGPPTTSAREPLAFFCSLPLSCHGHAHACGTCAAAGQQMSSRGTRAMRQVKGFQVLIPALPLPLPLHLSMALAVP